MRRTFAEKQTIVCFVGRKVPMKDVKGFIRAVPHLIKQMPEIKCWIIGSTDQDPKYAQECRELVENIMLTDVIEFKPHQNMADVLPQVKLLVLNAIRESMPLVILESFAAGVPVVATHVGACREMIMGVDDDDKAIGAAGCVVNVVDPPGLAKAIMDSLVDPELWTQMSQAAIKRVERYYDEKIMFEKYRQIYEGAIASWPE